MTISVPALSINDSFPMYYHRESYRRNGYLEAFSKDSSNPQYPIFQKVSKDNPDVISSYDYSTSGLLQIKNRYFGFYDNDVIYYFASDETGAVYVKADNGNYDTTSIAWNVTGTKLTITIPALEDYVLLDSVYAIGSGSTDGIRLYFLKYYEYGSWLGNVNITSQ